MESMIALCISGSFCYYSASIPTHVDHRLGCYHLGAQRNFFRNSKLNKLPFYELTPLRPLQSDQGDLYLQLATFFNLHGNDFNMTPGTIYSYLSPRADNSISSPPIAVSSSKTVQP